MYQKAEVGCLPLTRCSPCASLRWIKSVSTGCNHTKQVILKHFQRCSQLFHRHLHNICWVIKVIKRKTDLHRRVNWVWAQEYTLLYNSFSVLQLLLSRAYFMRDTSIFTFWTCSKIRGTACMCIIHWHLFVNTLSVKQCETARGRLWCCHVLVSCF